MTATGHATMAAPLDDIVIPFSIDKSAVRGRIVRLGDMVTDIIARHEYPEAVGLLVGETVALTALLGSALKFTGRFTLQARTDGPVDLLVADFSTPGDLRAYAHFDADEVDSASERAADRTSSLLGVGSLAMTIDQGPDMDRYQGVVPLDGGRLVDAAHVYFRQSEQIPTRLQLGAAPISTQASQGIEHAWRAGGIMIQDLPGEGGTAPEGDDDGWNRARHLLDSVEYDELLDPMLAPERLLYRLFHEDGVRAAPAKPLAHVCSCDPERVRKILRSFPPDDISDMIEGGVIRVTCEFCNSVYSFDPGEFAS